MADAAPRRVRRDQQRPRALRQLPRPARAHHGERDHAVHARVLRPGRDGSARHRASGGPDRRRRVGLLAARVRRPGRDGTRSRAGRHVRHRAAGRRSPGRRRRLHPSGDRHERHVRLPHARSGPRALGGTRRGRPHLPVRAAGRPAADAHRQPRRPGVVGRSAPWDRVLGAAPRDLPVGDRRRARPLLPGDAQAAGHREGRAVRARRSPARDPRGRVGGRRAHGAGQHLRQAVPGCGDLAGPPVGPRDRARQLGAARGAPRRAAGARLLVLRGGQLLRGDEEPDAGGRAGVPRRLRGRRRRVAGRRSRVHAPRPGGPAREAVLVCDGLRRRHALPHRQPAGARRPRLTRPGPPLRGRRVRRPALRARAAGRGRHELGADDPGPPLVLLLPLLRPARGLLRPQLEARRHHPRSRPAAPGPPGRSRRPRTPWRGTPRRASPGRPGACTARRGSAA